MQVGRTESYGGNENYDVEGGNLNRGCHGPYLRCSAAAAAIFAGMGIIGTIMGNPAVTIPGYTFAALTILTVGAVNCHAYFRSTRTQREPLLSSNEGQNYSSVTDAQQVTSSSFPAQTDEQASNSAALHQLGMRCLNAGQASQAVEYFRQAAEIGNAKSAYELAACYDLGRGVVVNKEEAIKWYQQAANGGNGFAKFVMLIMTKASRGGTIQMDMEGKLFTAHIKDASGRRVSEIIVIGSADDPNVVTFIRGLNKGS